MKIKTFFLKCAKIKFLPSKISHACSLDIIQKRRDKTMADNPPSPPPPPKVLLLKIFKGRLIYQTLSSPFLLDNVTVQKSQFVVKISWCEKISWLGRHFIFLYSNDWSKLSIYKQSIVWWWDDLSFIGGMKIPWNKTFLLA